MEEKLPTEKAILKAIDQVRMEELSALEGCSQIEDKLEQLQQFIPAQSMSAPRGEPGIKGFFKRILRKLLRWYIDPIIAQQDHINEQFAAMMQLLVCCIRDLELECARIDEQSFSNSIERSAAGYSRGDIEENWPKNFEKEEEAK